MRRRRLDWLWAALASAPVAIVGCGGNTDTPGSGGTSNGATGGASGAGAAGAGGTSGSVDASAGAGGGTTRPEAGREGGTPCGDAGTCPSNQNNPQNTRFCDIVNQRCVECLSNADCVGDPQGPVCNMTQGRCRECVVDGDCSQSPVAQRCMGNSCQVVCNVNADCATDMGNPFCNTTTRTCVECGSDADCATNNGNPHCNVAMNSCEECVANAGGPGTSPDCAAMVGQPVCRRNFTCGQCNTVADCPAGATGCSNGGTCQLPRPDAASDANSTPVTPVDARPDTVTVVPGDASDATTGD